MRPSLPFLIRPMATVIVLAALALAPVLTGCGLKGELYLPEEEEKTGATAASNLAETGRSDDAARPGT